MLGECVFEALERNQEALFGVVADWIEDNKRDHPEAAVYLKRLRSKRLRIRSVIDVVCKFGERGERKLFSRINRIILKMRHHTERSIPCVDSIFSLAGRQRINRFLGSGRKSSPRRKKPVLAMTRKRAVLDNEIWYVVALKAMLAMHYS